MSAVEYLSNALTPNPVTPQGPPTSHAVTLATLRRCCQDPHVARFGPTVGVVAAESGLPIAQTQRNLIWLREQGDVVEVERVKADGYQLRYLPKEVTQ